MSRLRDLIYLSHVDPDGREYTLQGGEEELAIDNPSIFKSRLFFLIFLVGNAAAAAFIGKGEWVIAGSLVGVTLVMMIIEYLRVKGIVYYVTNRRAIKVSRFLRPSIASIEFTAVKDIDESQTWVQSLFNIGTITFETYDGVTMKFQSVYHLRELERAVYMALPDSTEKEERDLSSVISTERLQNAEADRMRRED